MLCINDHNTDPFFNLAAEEYLLKQFTEDCFMLWRNAPSVIVGRHQNTLAEINPDYVTKNNIKVVRRLSGGGAVFHDLGNINFTFIENVVSNSQPSPVRGEAWRGLQPIIDVLRSLSIDAYFEGRNDLMIDGKKFSGSAKHSYRNRTLHHGTLLFASELADLSGALNANPAKFTDKAVKSVRSRVTNISNHLKEPLDIDEFRSLVIRHIMNNYTNCEPYRYTETDIAAICKLRDEKYATWNWNFGQSPGYNMINGIKTNGGYIEAHIDAANGIIRKVRIFGDFFNVGEIEDLEQLLIDTPHNEAQIREKLKQINISDYMINVTIDEFIRALTWDVKNVNLI